VESSWKLLSNHGLALVCIAREPTARLRDIADFVGITERNAHRIVSDLVDDGYVQKIRDGARSRNRYEINLEAPMRHPLMDDRRVGHLLKATGKRSRRLGSWADDGGASPTPPST
jgi:hypothetical protein